MPFTYLLKRVKDIKEPSIRKQNEFLAYIAHKLFLFVYYIFFITIASCTLANGRFLSVFLD